MNSHTIRILAFICGFVAVVVLPWWLSFIFILALTLYFPLYLEVIFFGFLVDILYKPEYNFFWSAALLSTLLLICIVLVKTRIRTA